MLIAEQYDVIVVGGGNAALCAALSAQEQGARVLILERAPQELRGGNTAFAGGGFRMVYHGLDDVKKFVPDLSKEEIESSDFGEYSAEQYLDDLARVTEYRCDPDLSEILVKRSTSTVEWLRNAVGIRFVPKYGVSALKHQGRWKFSGGSIIWITGGGRGLVDAQFQAAQKRGIAVRYNSRVVSLLHGREGVKGVRVAMHGDETDIRARAVVLACGGFEADREWRTRYLGAGWDLAKVRGTRYNTGDGIRMALDIGAQPHGHWSGAHACECDLNAPEYGEVSLGDAFSRHSYPFSVMINSTGNRFLDEGADLRNHTYAKYGRMILAQPGQSCWQVFDAKALDRLSSQYGARAVTKVTASTLEELTARLEGVNAARALKTISEFNAAVRQDVPFDPNIKDGRCTLGLQIPKSNWSQTIDTPPFAAYAVTCGITFTFGGLKISTKAEVIDVEERPIDGLYAAGELAAGIFYFNYPGGSGLTNGAVFGRIAGVSAAQYALNGRNRQHSVA